MRSRRTFSYISGIIALLVAPSMVSLIVYHITHNPSLRPFAVTEQSLRAFLNGQTRAVRIVAHVDWVPPRTGGYTQAKLTRALGNAFRAKGVEVDVKFRPGDEVTRISYEVGESTIGPYPATRAAEGISAAVEAYHMYVPIK
jgi:hypothetical protein